MSKGFDGTWQSIRQQQQSRLFCPATEIGQKLSRLLLCKILLSSKVLSKQDHAHQEQGRNAAKAYSVLGSPQGTSRCLVHAASWLLLQHIRALLESWCSKSPVC